MKITGFYTPQGTALLSKVVSGDTQYKVTKVTGGSGYTDVSEAALADEKQTLNVGSAIRDGTTVTFPVVLSASSASESYTLTEIGVYAEDPDCGEILCRIYRLDAGFSVEAGGRLVLKFNLQEVVSESSEISVVVSPDGLLTEGSLSSLMGAPGGLATLGSDGFVTQSQLPISFGTEDLEAGVSPLANGHLYFVYE